MIGLEYVATIRMIKYKDIAESIGVSSQTITDWIKGKTKNIPREKLDKLSDYFSIDGELLNKELDDELKIELLKYEINRIKKERQQ